MSMKLTKAEVVPVRMPVSDRLRIRDSYGWKTESAYNIVRITDDRGNVGIGEASFTDVWSGERQASSKEAIEQVLIPAIREFDLTNIRQIVTAMDRALYGHLSSKAAIEMALLDLNGKALGVPLYRLLGGRVRDTLPVKFSVSAVNDDRLHDIVDFAISKGIRTVKVKVGTGMEADLARVRAIRSAYGDDIRIAVDANNAWRLEEAKAMIARLEPYDPAFIEQPLAREDYRGARELRRFTACPIVLDESLFTVEQAMTAIREDAGDVYSVYPNKNGGVLKTVQILALVGAAKKIGLLGSNLELGIGSAAMAHIGISNEKIDDLTYPSDIIGPLYHTDDVITTPLRYENGRIAVPDGPGLGVSIDEDKLRYYRSG
ncbi:mandelate racemase/muconate lactonizing enzyme family protein [Paenibacillaceae bacterium WGS1546]|uniref:mandelate racemase/muconate lactonizing enzyme family protein n=1 Tax=Cohnella sp. WGS1546 TaxID=3366810 RepID=UPI00372D5D28